jgi:hypothetical protein
MNRVFEYETVLFTGPMKGTYAEFPFDSVKLFGTRKPIPVKVTFNGKPYSMNMLPNGKGGHRMHVKKEIRDALGKKEGDSVKVTVVKDDSPKTVEIPGYLQWLLDNDQEMAAYFEKMPYSAKKFWIDFIEEPKNDDTKVDRINRMFRYLRQHYSGKK